MAHAIKLYKSFFGKCGFRTQIALTCQEADGAWITAHSETIPYSCLNRIGPDKRRTRKFLFGQGP
jgi:hypothetical protein